MAESQAPHSGLSRLTALPAEILDEICSHLCWHCQDRHKRVDIREFKNKAYNFRNHSKPLRWRQEKAALASLNQTCRLLHTAAEPVLHHYLHTFEGFALYRFVRTLLERPDLQKRVFAVEVGGVVRVDRSDTQPIPKRITEAVEFHLSGWDIVHYDSNGMKRGPAEYSALVSVLLQLTPNLEHAHFHLPDLASFDTHTPSPVRPLTSLKSLAFSNDGRSLFLDLASPILWVAPNLEVLNCHDCVDVGEHFPAYGPGPSNNPAPLQSLRELGLTNASLLTEFFGNLLHAVGTKLSKVVIYHTPVSTLDIGVEKLEFDSALAALQPWTQTLRELLFLHSSTRRRPFLRSPHRLDAIRVLRDFHALEILQVEAEFLDFYGHAGPREEALTGILPPSIRELRLWGYSNLTPALQGFMAARGVGQFPHLRKIEIEDQGVKGFEPDGDAARELMDVAVCFQSSAVDFVVHEHDKTMSRGHF